MDGNRTIFNGIGARTVIVSHDGIEDWRGTFDAFCGANSLTVEEIYDAAEALNSGQSWILGGGAAAEFTVSLA